MRSTSVLVAVLFLAMVGCSGSDGDAGQVGPAGPPGAQGSAGAPGATTFAGMTDQLSNANVADNSISGAKLSDRSLSGAKLSLGSVASDLLQDGAVTAAKLANGAIDSSKVAAGAIGATQIAFGAVGSDQLQAGSVTAAAVGFRTIQLVSPDAMALLFGATREIRGSSVSVVRLPDSLSPQARVAFTLPIAADSTGNQRRVRIYWTPQTAVSGDVAWVLFAEALDLDGGVNIDDGFSVSGATALTPVNGVGVVQTTEFIVNLGGGRSLVPMVVIRDGTSVEDTATGAVDVIAIEVSEIPLF